MKTNINYKSDFKINETTERIALEVPFIFRYYVFDNKGYIASFDGTHYENCERKEDGSLDVYFNSHGLGVGPLKVERKYFISDKAFADGVWDVVSIDYTDVRLTTGETDMVDVKTVIVPPYIKGDKGDPMTWGTMTEEEREELVNNVAEAIDPEKVMTENEKARIEAENQRKSSETQRENTFKVLKEEMETSISESDEATKAAEKVVEEYDAKVLEQDEKLSELGSKVLAQNIVEMSYVSKTTGYISATGNLINLEESSFEYYTIDLDGVYGIITGESPCNNTVVSSYTYIIDDEIVEKGDLTTNNPLFSVISKGTGLLHISSLTNIEPLVFCNKNLGDISMIKGNVENLEKDCSYIKSWEDDLIHNFAYEGWVEFDASYNAIGLIEHSGAFTNSQTNYLTSDFIDITNIDLKRASIAFKSTAINVSKYFNVISFYDKDKKYIGGIKGSAGVLSSSLMYGVSVPYKTAFIKMSKIIDTQSYLYYATIESIDDVLNKIRNEKDEFVTNLIRLSCDELADISYYYNTAYANSKKITKTGFVSATIQLPINKEGDLLYVRVAPTLNFAGLTFYKSNPDENGNFNNADILGKQYFCVDHENYQPITGYARIPLGAKYAVIQSNVSNSHITKSKIEDGITQYLAASYSYVPYRTEDILERIDWLNSGGDSNEFVRFENFINSDALVGEYFLGRRTDGTGIIEASAYSLLVITDIQGKYINVKCNSSQYVPGVKFYNTNEKELFSNSTEIGSLFGTPSTIPVEYNTQIRIPDGVKAIVLQAKRINTTDDETSTRDYLAASFESVNIASKNDVVKLEKKIESIVPSEWKYKNIWWCGTSIPCGDGGKWSYPYYVGLKLSANVYNEAVGSSQANGSMASSTYYVISRRMGHTIEQKLQIFNDCWLIDDVNKTVSVGTRTMGITNIPSITDYDTACNARRDIICMSYEIKLIARYLISGESNTIFLKDKFGDLYDALISLHPNSYTYRHDVDLFVIDHSNNDNPMYEDIDSLDMTTYVGAINTYIRLIYKFKPHARIAIISNYKNAPNGIVETGREIASNWNVPFLDLTKYLNWDVKKKVLTRGYWDSNSIWHDSGFNWEESDDGVSYTTNMYLEGMSSRVKGDMTMTQIKDNIKPQYINGEWFWEGYLIDINIRDGLHPHTDKSGRCFDIYSKIIASFLNRIG